MNTSLLTSAILALAFTPTLRAQDKPLFAGAEHLDSCVVELPLTYSKKDKERYTQAARFLADDELIYLTYDKKSGTANYTRVFVVAETAKDGSDFVYIESTDDHMRMGGAKQALFPKFTPSKQRFYNAACFDAQVKRHPELTTILKEAPVGGK